MTNASATTAAIERKTRILRVTLAITVVSFITFLITLTSSNWIAVTYPPNFSSTRHNMVVVRSTYGIIRECIYGRTIENSILSTY